ncbi:MAG: PaaI family thioesterase [Alphaproteobacteria bacterium]|nr:PaaI family thioesterase [Alphaproteobacteria bacterium]
MARSTPQSAALGLRAVAVGPDWAVMAAPWRADLVGDPESGIIAGGVVTTLLDQTCGLAVSSKAHSEGRLTGLATLDLRIDYMRGAEPGKEIFARAHCYRLTRSIGFVRAAAYEHDEADPVATAQAAFALTAAPSGQARS